MNVYQQLLDAIAIHRVADRPDRYEPRRRKRRPKPYDRLMKPRSAVGTVCPPLGLESGKTKHSLEKCPRSKYNC